MSVKDFIAKKGPEILIGLGVASSIAAAVTAFFAAPKIEAKLNAKREELGTEKLDTKTIIKTSAKDLILPVALETTAVASIITGACIRYKRGAIAAAAAFEATNALSLYKQKAREVLSTSQAAEVNTQVAKAKAASVEPPSEEKKKDMPVIRNGTTLFIDQMTGQMCYNNLDIIKAKTNEFNKWVVEGGGKEFPLNDWYEMIGMRSCHYGDVHGGYIDEYYNRAHLHEPEFTPYIDERDNSTYIVITYDGHYLPSACPFDVSSPQYG